MTMNLKFDSSVKSTVIPVRLFHYWRSTSSWRVRWALAIKGIQCEMVTVDLLNGESESPEHLARNPLGYVPVLELSNGIFLTESIAIMEWLEEVAPTPALLPVGNLPADRLARARVRQLVELINADTQPLQNMTPQLMHSDDPEKRKAWAQYFINAGLNAYEKILESFEIQTGIQSRYSVGDQLTLADLCLVPQCYNADRFGVSLETFPRIQKIREMAMQHPTYTLAEPTVYAPK